MDGKFSFFHKFLSALSQGPAGLPAASPGRLRFLALGLLIHSKSRAKRPGETECRFAALGFLPDAYIDAYIISAKWIFSFLKIRAPIPNRTMVMIQK